MTVAKTYADIISLFGDGDLREFDKQACGEIIRREKLYEQVMDVIVDSGEMGEDKRTGFRVAWALDAAYFADRESFMPYIDRFVADFPRVRNRSAHRHYAKMLEDMMSRGMVNLDDVQAERIAEKCFDLLVDPQTKVAVKAWVMDILLRLAPRIDWVADNLAETLRLQMQQAPTPGIISRGTKTLRKLK